MRAAAALVVARLKIALVPFRMWRHTLGRAGGISNDAQAKLWANHVEWAAHRLPLTMKCLPKAMALSALLRRQDISHAVVFAVRGAELRSGDDYLHAWVESGGARIIGDLPGPWIETLRLGTGSR